MIRALARAHRWKRMLEVGRYRSAAEIAEANGVTRSFVNRLLRLTLLAPDIQEAILEGRQPTGMQLEVTNGMPSGWEEQQKHFSPACEKSGIPAWRPTILFRCFPYDVERLSLIHI